MEYGAYKIIHVVSIVLFFSIYGMAASRGSVKKIETIVTGILLVLILVGGFGLMARLGIPHGDWPLWIKAKFAIWFIIGATGHLVLKRFPQFAMKYFWISVGLLTLASYMANYKIN
ncbi:MAG: hypothetical protein CME62_07360 [Halobacteriovoraceae bacterium]|nr:hypothetical protein [Halobacteriovoraceae bacterium]|tara:strand:- start:39269 stop:39616 length:348 start_codon:yes stop_codon:yes gene_type:complete